MTLSSHKSSRQGVFDRAPSIQYVVSDPTPRPCAIIDPVLDLRPVRKVLATGYILTPIAILDSVAGKRP